MIISEGLLDPLQGSSPARPEPRVRGSEYTAQTLLLYALPLDRRRPAKMRIQSAVRGGNVASVCALGIGEPGRRPMKIALFAFLVFLGGAVFLLSFIADREMKAGDDRVVRKMSRSVIDPRTVSERSPYMRTER